MIIAPISKYSYCPLSSNLLFLSSSLCYTVFQQESVKEHNLTSSLVLTKVLARVTGLIKCFFFPCLIAHIPSKLHLDQRRFLPPGPQYACCSILRSEAPSSASKLSCYSIIEISGTVQLQNIFYLGHIRSILLPFIQKKVKG